MVRYEGPELRACFDRWQRQTHVTFLILLIVTSLWTLAPGAARGQPSPGPSEAAAGSVQKATSSDASAPAVPAVDLRALEQQLKQTLEKALPTVVAVSGGSGVVVSEDGYVLTVAHVGMNAGRRVRVTFADGRRVWGTTLGNDRGVDAGLIKLNEPGPFPFSPMGVSKDLAAGQWCIALGYPVSFERGKPPAVRLGRVLSQRRSVLVTDCTIMGGDSGGPLFDLDGNVIAVSSRCDDRLTVNIHVPVDCYRDTWERLVQSEDFNSLSRGIAYLGVAPQEGAEDARIGEVFPDSAASQAGLKTGDLLLKFDGQEIARYGDLPPLIRRRKPGDEVEIVLRRGDEVVTLKAKLGDRDD